MHHVRSDRDGRCGRLVGTTVWLVTAALASVSCGGTAPGGAAPPTAASPAAPSRAPSPASVVPTAPAAGSGATGSPDPGPTSWRMPDLVGSGLQDAQDAIQALTADKIFVTRSHDATGAGRHQVLDRDWTVCSQNVRPGATITARTVIDFGAVKLSEHCPT